MVNLPCVSALEKTFWMPYEKVDELVHVVAIVIWINILVCIICRNLPLTLQALSEEDRRLWLDAMDGKEPVGYHGSMY